MTIIHGDCLAKMRDMDAASIDLVVTDPPYGVVFMGKAWDKAVRVARVPAGLEAGRVRVCYESPSSGLLGSDDM